MLVMEGFSVPFAPFVCVACGGVVLWGCVLPECGLSYGVCGYCGVIGSRDA